jgi:hypothetical protein
MTIVSYIHDFDSLDISDFIKKYYATLRQNIFTDINYVYYIRKNFNKVQNMTKYICIPIFHRSYHNMEDNNISYLKATHKRMLKLLPTYLQNKIQIRSNKILHRHASYITDIDSYKKLSNIEHILMS